MPQGFGGKPPLGVIYNTSMSRPDSVLALAELYGFEGKRESRVGSICVTGAGLNTAIYIDLVARFYQPGPVRNGNQALAVGLAAVTPLPPDAAMLRAAIERKDEKDQPRYPRTIKRFADTSLAEAVIRNGVIFNADAVVVLSAPATYLAKSLDLVGAKELYKERVKRLVIVDTGAPQTDVPALRKVIAEWPTPVCFCGQEIGEALMIPGERIERDFAWSTAHPVVDAYRAYRQMPYDAPSWDVAAVHYAVHPDSGFFGASEPGTLTVSEEGRIRFSAGGGGNVRKLAVDPAQKEKALQAFLEIASAKPLPPLQRFRPPSANADAQQKPAAAPDKPAAAQDPAKPPVKKQDQ